MTAESMFHRLPDGGNAAIAGLIGIARLNGFTLIDVQMESPHVMRFGATLVDADAYTQMLAEVLRR